MVKNKELIWRVIAIICTLLWTIVLFAFNSFAVPVTLSVAHLNILYCLSIALSIMLIIFPTQFYLYVLMCGTWGLINLIFGGSTNGMLMYALGCAFAHKQGLFSKGKILKYSLVCAPIIAIALQYRLSIDVLVSTTIDFLFLAIFFMLVYLLFADSLMQKKGDEPSTKLDIFNLHTLPASEIQMLREVSQNKTLFAMAQDRNKSESSMKKQVSNIYKKLGIHNRGHFLQLYADGKLTFPTK